MRKWIDLIRESEHTITHAHTPKTARLKDGRAIVIKAIEEEWLEGDEPQSTLNVSAELNGRCVGSLAFDLGNQHVITVDVPPEFRRLGIATALYDYVDDEVGYQITPSSALQPDGMAFWATRRQRQGLSEAQTVQAHVSIDDLPLSAKQDILDLLLTNVPEFEQFWEDRYGIMSFDHTYVAQFIFGTEDLANSASEGYGDEQDFRVRVMTLHPGDIDNENRSVSDNVVAQYAALPTEPPPVLVRNTPKGWKIVEGGHRIAAAKLKGAKKIRAIDVSCFFDFDWNSLDA